MTARVMLVPLKGFGTPPTQVVVVVTDLSMGERVRRAGIVLGAGLLAALVALPIPLVHLIFVPGALLAGLAVGALRLGQREMFESAEGSCPFCGTTQRLGLAGRVFRLPRTVHCRTCGRALELGPDAWPAEPPG